MNQVATRADLAKARSEAATAVSGSADAAKAILHEVSKVKSETADLLAEIAELTNGGPPLDEPIGPTVIPPNEMSKP